MQSRKKSFGTLSFENLERRNEKLISDHAEKVKKIKDDRDESRTSLEEVYKKNKSLREEHIKAHVDKILYEKRSSRKKFLKALLT